MSSADKPLIWLKTKVSTPPFSKDARLEAGYLLRMLQRGHKLSLPHSRPMPSVGKQCHELRITDKTKIWRLVYRIDEDAIVIAEVFEKKTEQTPDKALELCKRRFKEYDNA